MTARSSRLPGRDRAPERRAESIFSTNFYENLEKFYFIFLVFCFIYFEPLISFSLYFCFLHSIRHSITLIFELDKSFKAGLKKFINRAIPLTFVTGLIFLLAIYFLNNFYKLDEAIYKVIFIGLASLTFPHISVSYTHLTLPTKA